MLKTFSEFYFETIYIRNNGLFTPIGSFILENSNWKRRNKNKNKK